MLIKIQSSIITPINNHMIHSSNTKTLKIDKLIYFIAPLIFLAPMYTYYMAVYK